MGGADAVETRELMLRIYTSNAALPTGSVETISSIETSKIIEIFGSDSVEFKMSQYYFGFISKVATSPKKIQFARWAKSDTTTMLFSSSMADLDSIKTITAASFDVTINNNKQTVSNVAFDKVNNYSEVVSALQTAIQTKYTNATVTGNFKDGKKQLIIDFKVNKGGAVELSNGTKNIFPLLGLDTAVKSDGVAKQTVTQVLETTTELNNNFGSYTFIDNLSEDETKESCAWVHNRNIEFVYMIGLGDDKLKKLPTELSGYASVCMTYNPFKDQYAHILPSAIMASQDFDFADASTNYMFQVDDRLSPSVLDTSTAISLDTNKVNYYGVTQESGKQISFYQRGLLCGDVKSPKYLGVHANEQWLKSSLKAKFLDMFIALQEITADEKGRALGSTYLNSVIEQAKINGVISVGKPLDINKVNYITQITGDRHAYQDVHNKGYWYNVTVNPDKNEMDYLLVYGKSDSINMVEGRHVLI